VVSATKDYRSGEDMIGAFLDERTAEGERVANPALYDAYRQWAERSGERPMTARAFGESIEERGHQRSRSNGRTWVLGLVLRQETRDGP
jgi:phage/plasmid-associated DNA primase